jgi:hypothetical protein
LEAGQADAQALVGRALFRGELTQRGGQGERLLEASPPETAAGR